LTGPSDLERADAAPVPVGARDVLPVESAELATIEDGLRSAFRRFGYREVRTPLLEFAEVMDRAQDGGLGSAFRLFDDHGNVLVLRPDLTIPVARLAASRLGDHPGPLRVSYVATTLRPAPPGKAQSIEERQAGIELLGLSGPAADAEIVAVLVTALRALGLADLRVAINDTAITRAVLDGFGIDPVARERLAMAARQHNLVAWRRVVKGLGLDDSARGIVGELPTRRGAREVVRELAECVPAAAQACDGLLGMLDIADRHGVGEALFVDFGVMRDWGYYSGIVFEAYTSGQGAPVAKGGRYDALGARFGRDRPAVGFSVVLDHVHAALAHRASAGDLADGVVVAGGFDHEIGVLSSLREAGILAIAATDHDNAVEVARADGWRWVASREDQAFRVTDRLTGIVTRSADIREALTS
jgi:ATP phosphoribosyltransferase regulatory subunit